MTVRELNGHARSTVTFDADGDVISVTVEEPRFTPGEVELLLASRRRQMSLNEHGIPYAEAMDPANQFRFKAIGPRMDYSVEAVRRAQERYREQHKGVDMSSLRFGVEKA